MGDACPFVLVRVLPLRVIGDEKVVVVAGENDVDHAEFCKPQVVLPVGMGDGDDEIGAGVTQAPDLRAACSG